MTGTGTATVQILQRLLDAFNAHDLDAVMGLFVDDPVLELPRGPHPGPGELTSEWRRSAWPRVPPACSVPAR